MPGAAGATGRGQAEGAGDVGDAGTGHMWSHGCSAFHRCSSHCFKPLGRPMRVSFSCCRSALHVATSGGSEGLSAEAKRENEQPRGQPH